MLKKKKKNKTFSQKDTSQESFTKQIDKKSQVFTLFSYKTEIILSRPIIFAKDPWLDFRRTELPASIDPVFNSVVLEQT